MKKYILLTVLILFLTPCFLKAQGGLLSFSELNNAFTFHMFDALVKPNEVNVLDLNNTNVTEMPEGTFFKNLQALYLANSPSVLAKWIDISSPELLNPANVLILDISNNNLESLPKGFVTMTNLVSLNMSGNPELIKWIDQSSPDIASVEILNISNNNLTTIPGFINKFALLKEINLSGNLICVKELDKSSPKIAAVEKLDFSNNKLTTIIDWLGSLEAGMLINLKELNLRGNPLKEGEIGQIRELLSGTKVIF